MAEEPDVARYVDPLGGSAVIERIAAEMRSEVEDWLRRIEDHGGMLGSIRSGWLESEIEDLAQREPGPRVGVKDQLRSETEEVVLQRERHKPLPLVQRGVERQACDAELKAIRDAVASGVNVLPTLIEAARARASIGQMCEAMAPQD
ncbi:methylmalonyl-CoA mutase family protein [Amycolatopsis sp. NPDC058340]|uniref:methylmalonyl-CoA mutase family protein n=1 Tax=Amycolatopsis sp. NPDC058340 TaxID=3346453 RepID=UPI003658443B